MLVAIVLAVVLFASAHAFADPKAVQAPTEPAKAVALLPLDADAKLELFGQSVATEIARVLMQGGLDVVVVRPPSSVPGKARIVVDGTIKASKGNAIMLTVRVRDVRDGAVLDTIPVEASMTTMDRGAEDLSAKVFPSVKSHLAALIEKDQQELAPKHFDEPKRVEPAAPKLTVLAAVITSPAAAANTQMLRTSIETALAPWATRRHHVARVVDIHLLGSGAKALATERADVAVELEVLSLDIESGAIPMARARVHLKIVDPQAVVFDRVIVTDTIVGEKGLDRAKLAERAAREVLAIADPQLKRRIPTWY
jgi:hypothetical protein